MVSASLPAAVRGIVFDLDGTLVDSYGAIADSLNHARRAYGLSDLGEDHVRRVVGRGLESLIAEHVGADRVEPGVALFRERYAAVFARQTSALPEVPATLAAVHALGIRMAVASNKPARFSRAILETLELAAWFDTVEGPDTVGSTKPEPEMVRRCLDVMGVARASAMYVGDMVLDVETADRAGVAVVLVTGGSSESSALAGTGRIVLSRFADLLPLVSREDACRPADPGV